MRNSLCFEGQQATGSESVMGDEESLLLTSVVLSSTVVPVAIEMISILIYI
jgi:hypothetical protein